jgi:hypothetical protein
MVEAGVQGFLLSTLWNRPADTICGAGSQDRESTRDRRARILDRSLYTQSAPAAPDGPG